jgi:nucleoid-associated protein Lsr2
MAQKTIVSLIDDLDGGEAAESVRFGLDGAWYEIDLSEGNADTLRAAFAPYVSAGRRAGSTRGAAKPPASLPRRPTGDRVKEIREWANANGFRVSDRGRIALNIVQAYDDAH